MVRTLHSLLLAGILTTGWLFAQQPAPCPESPTEGTDQMLFEQQKQLWIEQHPEEYQEMLKISQTQTPAGSSSWTAPVTRSQFLQMDEPMQRNLVPSLITDLLQAPPPQGTPNVFLISEDQFIDLPVLKQIHILKNPTVYYVIAEANLPQGPDLSGAFTREQFFGLTLEQMEKVDISQIVDLDQPIPPSLPEGARIVTAAEFRASGIEQRIAFLKHPELYIITE